MTSELFKQMEEDLEFFKNLEREDSERMAENDEFIKTSLHELRERVEELEKRFSFLNQWREVEDRVDQEALKQFKVIAECINKQREWNKVMEETTELLRKLIEIKTGGQK